MGDHGGFLRSCWLSAVQLNRGAAVLRGALWWAGAGEGRGCHAQGGRGEGAPSLGRVWPTAPKGHGVGCAPLVCVCVCECVCVAAHGAGRGTWDLI